MAYREIVHTRYRNNQGSKNFCQNTYTRGTHDDLGMMWSGLCCAICVYQYMTTARRIKPSTHLELLRGHEHPGVDAQADGPAVGHEEVRAVGRHHRIHHLAQKALQAITTTVIHAHNETTIRDGQTIHNFVRTKSSFCFTKKNTRYVKHEYNCRSQVPRPASAFHVFIQYANPEDVR